MLEEKMGEKIEKKSDTFLEKRRKLSNSRSLLYATIF